MKNASTSCECEYVRLRAYVSPPPKCVSPKCVPRVYVPSATCRREVKKASTSWSVGACAYACECVFLRSCVRACACVCAQRTLEPRGEEGIHVMVDGRVEAPSGRESVREGLAGGLPCTAEEGTGLRYREGAGGCVPKGALSIPEGGSKNTGGGL